MAESRASWIGTLSEGREANWDTCIDFQLWGTGSNNGRKVSTGDQLFVWQAEAGWVAHCEVTTDARRPSVSDPAPWIDGHEYKWIFGIRVLAQFASAIDPGSEANRQKVTGIWNIKLGQFSGISQEERRNLLSLFEKNGVALSAPTSIGATWSIEAGTSLSRRELHDLVGGNRQRGITRPSGSRNILLFSDPKKGKKYGYDKFEGLRIDGTFGYTGEGKSGDQSLESAGNRLILSAEESGYFLRLFESDNAKVTYVGEMKLGDPAFEVREAPDENNQQRQVIVFTLVPVGHLLPPNPPTLLAPLFDAWTPPSDLGYQLGARSQDQRTASRSEMTLQRRYGLWLESQGYEVKSVSLPIPGTQYVVFPDIYNATQRMVVEAKKSAARNYVREALGQVLDYQHLFELFGEASIKAGILLPDTPDSDLIKLCHRHGVSIVVPKQDGFADLDESLR